MDLGVRGKVALVCGASRGIAYATAVELAQEGAQLAICSRDAVSLASAKARLEAMGASVLAVVADLSTVDGIARVVSEVTAHYGRVDILVANTGGPPTGAPMEHAWSTWEQATHLLLRSVVELTRAFVPGMCDRKWGRVIAITSKAVKYPVNALVLSNSLRAAVTGYLRTLATDVGVHGVTVNSVMPGMTDTERLGDLAAANTARTGATKEAIYDGWRAGIPVKRLGRPEELAAVIAFLASDRAGFVTGQAICVDGGEVATLL